MVSSFHAGRNQPETNFITLTNEIPLRPFFSASVPPFIPFSKSRLDFFFPGVTQRADVIHVAHQECVDPLMKSFDSERGAELVAAGEQRPVEARGAWLLLIGCRRAECLGFHPDADMEHKMASTRGNIASVVSNKLMAVFTNGPCCRAPRKTRSLFFSLAPNQSSIFLSAQLVLTLRCGRAERNKQPGQYRQHSSGWAIRRTSRQNSTIQHTSRYYTICNRGASSFHLHNTQLCK